MPYFDENTFINYKNFVKVKKEIPKKLFILGKYSLFVVILLIMKYP